MREINTRAHGRVNLIGEHTDYNGGWVLPTTIPQHTNVTLIRRADKKVVLHSSDDPKKGTHRDFTYELDQEKKLGTWVDYLQGATYVLGRDQVALSGFELKIQSTVPEGSGLSSSAALEMAVLKAIRDAFQLDYTDPQLALLGQKIENDFVGARVGIMDQMACSLAREGEALFLDTQTLNYERIPLPLEHMDLLVINSGIAHRNVGGGYNQRRSECEQACRELGVASLREINSHELSRVERLPDVLARRTRHVVTENARVFSAVEALRRKDPEMLGRLFHESHLSMRDDYEVSIPEIDQLVELCRQDHEVFGARLTGGGFGGSIVALTHKGRSSSVADRVVPQYEKKTGQKATVLV